ncbi:MAG: TonB-dependent receptor [Terracidiphilus sp.]
MALGAAGASAQDQPAATPPPASAPVVTTPPAAPTANAASAAKATLRGHVADPTGALIPGATVTVTNAAGVTLATTTADEAGAYQVTGLAPGSYIVLSSVAGFAPFASQPLQLAAGQTMHVKITMALAVEQQSVVVTDETPTVNVEAGGNASAMVLKDKDLDALSDDPDELSNELMALAGPSAGPNGGQIYIDGFSGGQLPPKSAIREIRINQNPFSAEFDRIGYGRIEILTKPGTDKLRGQFFLQGNDNAFNTANPYSKQPPAGVIPPYYSYQFNGTLSGSLSKKASYFLSAEQRNTENINAWSIPDAVMLQYPSLPADKSTNIFVEDTGTNGLGYPVNLLNRRIRDNASARIDLQLGPKNTFTARYGFWSESEHGDLNQGSLINPSPTAANPSTHESNTDHTVQLSDAIVINDHIVNESRFQYERQNENHYPDSTALTINVTGDFTGGGYSGQQSLDHTTRLEFQNMTTMSHGAHAIKFGTRLRDSRDANQTSAGFNGAFTFATPDIYLAMANGLLNGESFSTLAQTLNPANQDQISLSYVTEKVAGKNSALANIFDMAWYAQDDWKFNPRLTLSGGLRWESQNHISDHNDWAPRAAFAYALDGNGKDKKAKTVLRAGYGFFYDRLGSSSLLGVYRSEIQNQIVLNNPTGCTDGNGNNPSSLDAIAEGNFYQCSISGNSAAPIPTKYEIDPHYHSPYNEQGSVSLERQLNAGTNMTLTYMHTFGVHQTISINAHQAPDLIPQNNGYVYQIFPEAEFKENQIIASLRGNLTKKFNLTGFYTLSFANGNNNGNAVDRTHLDKNYGRSGFITRNNLFMMANYSAPWGIRLNPFLVAQSGRPYNITLDSDPLNGFGNQRPSYDTNSNALNDSKACTEDGDVWTTFGCLNPTPASGDTLIPINLGNGPAAVAFNLRISKAIGLGAKLVSANTNPPDGGPPPGGPPPGGGHGGGGGRGGPGGGGPGGGGPMGLGGGGNSTGRRYSLTFSAQALNLFNDIDKGQPNGTIVPKIDPVTKIIGPGNQFGQSTNLAGGIFSSGSAARRIFVQAVFSF